MIPPKPLDLTIKEALEHQNNLYNERQLRHSNRHPSDDSRIATEIAAHQFALGQWKAELIQNNDRFRKAIESNNSHLIELESAHNKLQTEMDIALNRDTK